MISICIPVYNFNITKLVKAIEQQIGTVQTPIELVVIDDASKEGFKMKNRACLSNHVYIELPENIGRARIRNLFKKYVSHPYMLFLDCDVLIPSKRFISNYFYTLKSQSCDVVCGGLEYSNIKPERERILRWEFGLKRECASLNKRSRKPFAHFLSSNFLIKKEVFAHFLFDESLIDYGYEDTLLAFNLKKGNKELIHIENSVIHNDKDTNGVFIKKSEKALRNLLKIFEGQVHKKEFESEIRILRGVLFCEKYRLTGLIFILYKAFRKPLKKGLVKGYLSKLVWFDFYKLGYLICLKKERI